MTTMNFQKVEHHLRLGRIVPLLTYSLTVEPTMSFWDCGEYIATAAN
jgi:hypothetical protein